jgi:hypothetical protein
LRRRRALAAGFKLGGGDAARIDAAAAEGVAGRGVEGRAVE